MNSPAPPILSHPTDEPSAFTPDALLAAVRAGRGLPADAVPAVCVLDFDGDLTDWLVARGRVRPCPAWACFHTTMFVFQIDGRECGLIPRTIGGPYAVLVAEQLAASRAQVILGLTSAGRVRPDLPIPSIVVAASAVRDEGTSYHYLPPAGTVDAPLALADALLSELSGVGLPTRLGMVWTTDAPYRETQTQLAEHAADGVCAVEMQAASLFAFGSAKGVAVGIVAQVSNAVDHTGQPFDKGEPIDSLLVLELMCRAAYRYRSTLGAAVTEH
ncbi:MAG: nucleoside phosphorylase [Bryobacteraceae bacterium]